ncbi:MAG: hypothetical protein KGR48_09200 [Alphaproteobacteria bacterium]|nr:hypothetical protein [Alphaproteobacteria bacterium]MBU6472461.1 hypothetical protein [Alphaproteobacteria bacterium]MDE2011578.1 hypothetical protein [Alphaproteobacteria bacterium]MDE2071924.1 hypothetical protein [Alphaproteobacteria bacterium]MDE2351202.1 hypothetical protein [Alphaproteobacteria bacterium]
MASARFGRAAAAAVGLCSLALIGGPAVATGAVVHTSTPESIAPLSSGDEVVPVVAPGEEIGIACDALQYTAPNNDVRVVLTISSAPSGTPSPGYKKVLATNEQLTKGAVRVTIPETPDLANHTVHVDVYVVSAEGARDCDAGHMRIADRSKHPKGKQS